MAVPLFVPPKQKRSVVRDRKLICDITDEEIEQYTGFPIEGFLEIIKEFEPLKGRIASAVPLETKVLVFLSHLKSGSFQYILGASFGLAQSTVSDIINDCIEVLIQLAPDIIRFPSTLEEINAVKLGFSSIAGFPNVIGLIDGTQTAIKAPKQNEEVYVCRKQYHSINTQVICGPDFSIFDLVAKYPGSTHDSFIWKYCGAKTRIEDGEFGSGWILGDSGYPLQERLLTPYLNEPEEHKRKFNICHKKTRCAVERAIGTWKSRFRSIDRSAGYLCYDEKKCCKIIVASAVLHNICVRKGIPLSAPDVHYRDNYLIPAEREARPILSQNQIRKRAADLREFVAKGF